MKIDVLGVEFDDIFIDDAASLISHKISEREKCYIVTPNPEIVWMCRKNPSLEKAVSTAGLVLADGVGITIGAKILGTPFKNGRVPGIDFIAALFKEMAKSQGRVYLLGAKPGVADIAGEKLSKLYPGIIIAGTGDGYFSDDALVIEKINNANADILLVCLGAPKQELWMAQNLEKLNVPVCAGLGGSLDVFAGNVKRAPVIFRKLGLEWLYRIASDPKRIKRSVVLPLFILRVIVKRIIGR